jgi:hypothetical protein
VAVPERGAKVRVVTAGDSSETVRGHVLRDIFWPILDSLPVAYRGEHDEDSRACAVLRSGSEGDVVVSTDLSAATDYAPFELAEAVWTGVFAALVDRGDCDPTEASIGLREVLTHLGPHLVEWPTRTAESRRGWLMGHPLTWLTLNLAHCAILDLVGLSGRAVVKGDDALAVCSMDEALDYLEALELAGFVVNRSKTFLSTDAGTFCERLFLVGGVAVPTTPVKRICAPTVERLSTLAKEIDRLPRSKRRSAIAVLWSRSSDVGLFKACWDLGIPLSCPRALGGLGVPHRRGLAGALGAHLRWATYALTSATSGEVIPLWEPPVLADGTHAALKDLRWVSRVEHGRGNLGSCVPMSDEAFRRFIGVRAFGLSLARPVETRDFKLSHVGAQWKVARKRYLSAGRPPRLIRPVLWTWERLEGALAASALSGIYTTDWTVRTVQQGLTLDEVKGAWSA